MICTNLPPGKLSYSENRHLSSTLADLSLERHITYLCTRPVLADPSPDQFFGKLPFFLMENGFLKFVKIEWTHL